MAHIASRIGTVTTMHRSCVQKLVTPTLKTIARSRTTMARELGQAIATIAEPKDHVIAQGGKTQRLAHTMQTHLIGLSVYILRHIVP
jgi:hypothetical protein